MTEKLIHGDCIEMMKTLEPDSVDAIVTDPPYELGFMGKKWDNTGIAYNVAMWQECLRVLKPGGHLLAFGGTRTYHRMTVAIEDAGFEVRDMIEWVYGSGFPKSLNIGKAVDQLQGNERENIGAKPYTNQNVKGNAYESTQAKTRPRLQLDETKGNSEWEGWGTALKPAHEPICLARKPLSEKTIVENVLKYGTGGINIDGCRVETEGEKITPIYRDSSTKAKGWQRPWMADTEKAKDLQMVAYGKMKTQGRFPANLIHDGSDEVKECFPETSSGGTRGDGVNKSTLSWKNTSKQIISNNQIEPDSGNASRYFKSIIYTSKASPKERNQGLEGMPEKQIRTTYDKTTRDSNGGDSGYARQNHHPTVKPVKLMEYLVTMVTPKGGKVLDPFMGSGSTGLACQNLGFDFIGIEKESEYVEIARARLQEKYGLFSTPLDK